LRDALVRLARSGSDLYRRGIQSGLALRQRDRECGALTKRPAADGDAPQGPAREIGLQAWFSRNGKLFVTQADRSGDDRCRPGRA
jgi:hypothetical protein